MGTTWSDLQKHMRSSYKLDEDTPDMLSMVWTYDDGRSQKIIVRRYHAFDRDMVEFKSPFCRVGDADHETLLRENAKLPLATVALSGDVFLVVYNAVVEGLRIEDFDFVLSRVADVADSLEERYAASDSF